MADVSFYCSKLNNLKESEYNTKHTFKILPNGYSLLCLQILDRFFLIGKLEIDDDGNVKKVQNSINHFHSVSHIPPKKSC